MINTGWTLTNRRSDRRKDNKQEDIEIIVMMLISSNKGRIKSDKSQIK